jgi:excisionase family DNA binding protein
MESKLMSIAEAASTLSVSKDTVRRLIRSGKLRQIRISRRVLLSRESIASIISGGVDTQSPSGEVQDASASS